MNLTGWSWLFLLGSVWHGVTGRRALLGFCSGAVVFILIHSQIVSALWPELPPLRAAGEWFAFNARSPYSAATMAAIAGVMVTVPVSKAGSADAAI